MFSKIDEIPKSLLNSILFVNNDFIGYFSQPNNINSEDAQKVFKSGSCKWQCNFYQIIVVIFFCSLFSHPQTSSEFAQSLYIFTPFINWYTWRAMFCFIFFERDIAFQFIVVVLL